MNDFVALKSILIGSGYISSISHLHIHFVGKKKKVYMHLRVTSLLKVVITHLGIRVSCWVGLTISMGDTVYGNLHHWICDGI